MNFKPYLLMLCGVIILTMLIDILLPNKSMSKLIKSISSLIIFVIIVTPILNAIKNYENIDYTNMFEYELIESNNTQKTIETTKSLLISYLESKYKVKMEVKIEFDVIDSETIINKISVKPKVLTYQNMNIDIKNDVVSFIDVDESKVIVYE